ncbi:DUF4214 domain-containing protein [Massilia sp. G4R7]|uniref:DUF4214 domain-containing protein n=1 Tax=Massilia phyllostachyos TaxID=2898585 RepID=A0ABS8Q0M8_9BURK|nr:DUF4214 domain-containing protein [Massilia phyllostachyos]MCD2515305.1 DUF4214 domain-containing protein [Massilia phyllostachyos]
MATDYVNEVQKLYVAYFGRPADTSGMGFWVNQLQNNPSGYEMISNAFSTSPEYQQMYGGQSNREVVLDIYRNVFGREGDQGGVDFWTARLDAGDITVGNAVVALAQSAVNANNNDGFVFKARVGVATAFTEHLNLPAEQNAYAGPAAMQIAMDYVGGVRDITTAAQHMDPGQIDAAIARIVGTPSGMVADMGFVA